MALHRGREVGDRKKGERQREREIEINGRKRIQRKQKGMQG